MIALDREERFVIAGAIELYLASLGNGRGDSIDVARVELEAVRRWWADVLRGLASSDDPAPIAVALRLASPVSLAAQVERWLRMALRFYVTYGPSAGEAADDLARAEGVLGRMGDEGLAAAA